MVMIGDVKKALEAGEWDTVVAWFENNTMEVSGNEFLLTLAKMHAPVPMFELLIRKGADPNEKNQYGDTALTIAIWHDAAMDVVDCLLQAGADVNQRNQSGNSPITLAAELDRVDVVKLLLKFGANVHAENNNLDTALTLAIWKRASLELVECLLEHGKTRAVQQRNKNGSTPLCMACEINADVKIVELLLDKGADVNSANKHGDTPLIMAMWRNASEDIVRALLRANANVNHRNEDGNAALHVGAQANANVKLIQLLVQHKFINVNQCNKHGDTALTLAAWKNASITLVKLLIFAGASVRTRNYNGNTAAALAVQANASPLLIELLRDCEHVKYADREIDFDAYVDQEALLEDIFNRCEGGAIMERRSEYEIKFAEHKLTNWNALRALTVDVLVAEPLLVSVGDAVQLIKAIEQADLENRRMWQRRQQEGLWAARNTRLMLLIVFVCAAEIYLLWNETWDFSVVIVGVLALLLGEETSRVVWVNFSIFHTLAVLELYKFNLLGDFTKQQSVAALAHFALAAVCWRASWRT